MNDPGELNGAREPQPFISQTLGLHVPILPSWFGRHDSLLRTGARFGSGTGETIVANASELQNIGGAGSMKPA